MGSDDPGAVSGDEMGRTGDLGVSPPVVHRGSDGGAAIVVANKSGS